jgi:flagellar biosynthesis protein FlhG
MAGISHDQAATLRQGVAPTASVLPQSKKAICCLAIASGKGGVGKTFLTVNLAIAFRRMNRKVLLVDADLGLANADILFGVHPENSLQDALFKGRPLSEIVTRTSTGVDLLAASSGSKEMIGLGQARMSMFVQELISFASLYDVLLFDCAAGIDSNVTSFIAATPQTLIVATPQPTSMMDVYALTKLIHQDRLTENVSLVVNMAENDGQGMRASEALSEVTRKFLSKTIELVGIIPESVSARKALKSRTPLMVFDDHDPASVRIREIASRLARERQGMTLANQLDGDRLVAGMFRT